MIDELHIAGLGVIEDVDLVLSPGLTVVTGETGAGKTMVVTALELLLGARADTSLVRAGTGTALIEARVAPPPVEAVQQDWVADDATDLVVSRELLADEGRSRARIGGRLAPVSALAEVVGTRVEVHGQGEHARLARPDVQRRLVDRYAGDPHARTLAAYREAYRAWSEASARLGDLSNEARERARELDRLEHEIAEIEAAAPDPLLDGPLDEDVERLEHAEQLTQAAVEAATALGEDGAAGPTGVAVSVLRRASGHDRELDGLLERAEGLAADLVDVRTELRRYAEAVDADPSELDRLRRRQRTLADLTRKYGPDIDAVLTYADEARHRAEVLRGEESEVGELERTVEDLRSEVERLAADVHSGRAESARRLAASVSQHLEDLAMPHAAFAVEVEAASAEPGPHGGDQVTFTLAANPGEPTRPLAQAASGGERSRVALAVEVALADVHDADVLVFDEVDAGVGGATAMAVGEKLARLARGGRQVLCVTHLAQLAAFADVHHVVEKGIRDGRTVTTTRRVTEEDRPAELARMLSGDAGRGAGLDHARELLDEAAARRESAA